MPLLPWRAHPAAHSSTNSTPTRVQAVLPREPVLVGVSVKVLQPCPPDLSPLPGWIPVSQGQAGEGQFRYLLVTF